MKMKRLVVLLSVILLVTALVTGCGKTESDKKEPGKTETGQTETGKTDSESAKTGLAVITGLSKSTDAGTDPGLAQVDSTVVAVLVDNSGKILDCVIDSVQSKINFDSSGKLITPIDTLFPTKNELGKDYGMHKASGIGKEWNEQAAVLAEYVKGKTVNEIKSIAVDGSGHPTGSDLKASVTISISGYIDAIEKAVAQAQELGASTSDKLGLGIITNMSHSVDAGDDPGLAEAYSTYVVITQDSGGKITSCIIDASQGKVNFDKSGKITSDIQASVKTKNELGKDYGMAKASSIGKEWYEQAAAFAQYVTGKTPAEVASIAVDEDGKATDSDLLASVTVSIDGFKEALAKAAR